MAYSQMRPIGDILKSERNIILKNADAATRGGFTQVPNFLLKSKNLSAGDKLAFAMLLSYAARLAARGRPAKPDDAHPKGGFPRRGSRTCHDKSSQVLRAIEHVRYPPSVRVSDKAGAESTGYRRRHTR
jgi:hypothetical protein